MFVYVVLRIRTKVPRTVRSKNIETRHAFESVGLGS
jgi:hypothetical protein